MISLYSNLLWGPPLKGRWVHAPQKVKGCSQASLTRICLPLQGLKQLICLFCYKVNDPLRTCLYFSVFLWLMFSVTLVVK